MPLPKITSRETILAGCLLILLAGQVALTLTAPGQTDEISYINPGASWALGDGFVSNMWFAQEVGRPWAGSTPGMPLLYGAWFKLVGFGFLQSRIASLALHLLGVGLLTRWASRRYMLNASATLGFACLLLLLPSVVLAGVSCRLEVFALILFSIFLGVYFPPQGASGSWVPRAVLGATFLAFFGAHFIGFYVLACVGVFLASPDRARFLRGLAYAAGIALGVALMWAFFARQGVWDDFVSSRTRYMNAANTAGMDFLLHGWRVYAPMPDVVGLGLLCLGLVAASFSPRFALDTPLRRASLAGVVIYMAVPMWISGIGIYYINYAWMVALPLACIFAPWAGRLINQMRVRYIGMVAVIAIAAYVSAAGYLLVRNIRLTRQYDGAASYVTTHASRSQAMVISQYGYYQFRERFPLIYLRATPSGLEARRPAAISWVVEERAAAMRIAKNEGGGWREVASYPYQPGALASQDVIVLTRE